MTGFQHDTPVYFDELDLNGHLHNTRFGLHVERATSALFESLGYGWTDPADRHPDLVYAVRELRMEFLAPFGSPGLLRTELWVDKLGTTSCVYGFRCTDPSGRPTFARGQRVVVKLGPGGRPEPWSATMRDILGGLHQAGGSPADEEHR
ncbi:acyl-CoA thioester hydrolase [Crossiella equi]|uniref:Acyl-CoA thioester hydrolase n=1 Tax=Crossiella equi TaxID=130796 RepID=A0ABS5AN51_9PSEU|nr:hotdog domain-containing protein [Crossiella equi]MBP2477822.1 acyl-CoA thioester hydrolase [Crossiella equi]